MLILFEKIQRRPLLYAGLALCIAASGCRKAEAPSTPGQQIASPHLSSATKTPLSRDQVKALFDLKSHPDAIILHPVDPGELTESQRKFGVAPTPDPKVEYQPGIIIMEHGDQAIRSFGSDGLTWTFDASAPHVNEFQMGKIVFATGRACGRIIMLKPQGDTVKVILGPVQLTEIVRSGSFAMDAPLDMDKMIPYVYPDFPQYAGPANHPNTAGLPAPEDHWNRTIVVSRITKTGKWIPATMTKITANGQRSRYQRIGKRWSPLDGRQEGFSLPASGPGVSEPHLQRALWTGQAPDPQQYRQLPGAPLFHLPRQPTIQPLNIPSIPNVPILNLGEGGIEGTAQAIGHFTKAGVTYSYEKDGVTVVATAMIEFRGARVQFFFTAPHNNVSMSAGLALSGDVAVTLHVNSHTNQEFHINVKKRVWLPVSLSIPLGVVVAVPLNLTFDQALNVNTGFSARNSILNADGTYIFTGGLTAGIVNGSALVQPSLSVSSTADIGNTVEGISVGITSLLLGAQTRAMVGLGAGPFNAGVYATVRYTGTMLRGTDIGAACRQGTIEAWLDTGVGYSMPQVVADAINFFLSFVTDVRIERAGSIAEAPPKRMFHGCSSNPGNCAGDCSGK
jgi:hypothetical protein